MIALLAAILILQDPGHPDRVFDERVPTTTSSSSTSSSSSSSTTTSLAPTTTTIVSGALSFYVSPAGSDVTGDGRKVNPFRTATFAQTLAKAGDAVLLMDNDDAHPHVPFKAICSGTGATTQNGVTFACEHEGACSIIGDGSRPVVEIGYCDGVSVVGIAGRSADNTSSAAVALNTADSTFYFHHSTRLQVWRNIADRNNRFANSMPLRFENVTSSMIAENACLHHSRHCISLYRSNDNRLMRNWIADLGTVPSNGVNSPGGNSQESIAIYPGARNLIANNVIEGDGQGWGINVEGAGPTDGNRVLGNTVVGTYLGAKVFSRPGCSSTDPAPCPGVKGTLVQDLVVAHTTGSFTVRDSVSLDTFFDRVTGYANRYGFQSDDPGAGSSQLTCLDVLAKGTPGITLTNSTITGSVNAPDLTIEACKSTTKKCAVSGTASGSRSLMTGCVAAAALPVPADLGDTGTKCLVHTSGPGADVRCKIADDGTPTHEPLWGADGQFRFCPPVRPGWDSAGETCGTYAARRLNQRPDGSGCPLSSLGCP